MGDSASELVAPDRIVIVGGGECAAQAADELRKRGYRGPLTMLSDEPYLPYERPPLSKPPLLAAETLAAVTALTPQRADELGLNIELNTRVVELDTTRRCLRTANGSMFRYDVVLLALGARPRQLSIPGAEHVRVLRTYDDALSLRAACAPGAAVVVVGAGLIGLEVAAAARLHGCSVTVLEAADRPLSRVVAPAISDAIAKRHLAEGVDIRCGMAVKGVVARQNRFVVELDGAGDALIADVVVAGIGSMPNIELAASAGISCGNGIVTDELLQTSAPEVFAAGDCCCAPHPLFPGSLMRPESWRIAHDQARVAAANMLGAGRPWSSVPWFWSDHYELNLQVAGVASYATQEVVRHRGDGLAVRFGLDDAGRVVSVSGLGPGTVLAKDIRLGERLIAQRSIPDPSELADPTIRLKGLLRSTEPLEDE